MKTRNRTESSYMQKSLSKGKEKKTRKKSRITSYELQVIPIHINISDVRSEFIDH